MDDMNDSRSWPKDSMNLLELWLTWKASGHENKVLEVMNNSKLWWYEQLGILWSQSSRFYELIRVGKNINDFVSWAQAFRCYELLNVMDDMNNSGSWA